MHRRFARPGPAAEACALVVGEGAADLGLGVHHERAVLRHRLADRAALQHEEFGAHRAAVDDLERLQRIDLDRGVRVHRLAGELQRLTRLAMPLSTAACVSSSQIWPSNGIQGAVIGPSSGSCSAPPTLIGMTRRPARSRRNVSTSVRTHLGACSVPELAITTSTLELGSALRSAASSCSPGAASSSLKKTVKSRSRSRRAYRSSPRRRLMHGSRVTRTAGSRC